MVILLLNVCLLADFIELWSKVLSFSKN